MTNKILILGGYGNFGGRISRALAKSGVSIIIAGRSEEKAATITKKLKKEYPEASIEIAIFDANKNLSQQLKSIKPIVVINTCGPFQNADYSVAETCIEAGVHYIDLADGRDFVRNITSLDDKAKEKNLLIVSGASTVPGLSSAVLEEYKYEFSEIDSLTFGIAPGQKAARGLATTQAIMTYVGKKLKPFAGHDCAYGWQDIYRQNYPQLGKRWMANCEVPDLDLLPAKYGIKSIRFSAGLELSVLHLGLWLMSWLVRLRLPLNLPKLASPLLKISNWFNRVGSADGGMHIILNGTDTNGEPKEIKWFIIAKNGDGPHIPTVPAIILAKKLAKGELSLIGSHPCVGLVSLEEYLAELKGFDIEILGK